MGFHAEHGIFFERRRTARSAAAALALTCLLLFVNVGARSWTFSLAGTGLGATLLFTSTRGRSRLALALGWLIALLVLGGLIPIALDFDREFAFEAGARVACGVVWGLWLGTQVDWASLRQLLLRLRIPEEVVESLDQALMQGVLTRREWVQRRDAARLRLGSPHLPLGAWGPLLGEGALQAFARLEGAEENALLRGAPGAGNGAGVALHLEDLSVERGGQRVLERLSLRLAPAEWLVLCGCSGAGKSSLLRVLAGLDAPAEGHMTRFAGRISPEDALRVRLDGRVALLCQSPEHHFIASTVAEDIAWGLLRRGVDDGEARRRAREMSEALHIDHLLDRPCYQISYGEQRRVALAGLLVLEPDLLLLDEPTAGLDPVGARKMRGLVEDCVSRSGAACIWATHDFHSLPSRAERVVLLRDRSLLFDGAIDEGLSEAWLVQAGLSSSPDENQMR